MAYGLSSHRPLSHYETQLFLGRRNLLYSKFWAAQGLPPSSSQITLHDALCFISDTFAKRMPSTASLVVSYLYMGNRRSMAERLGYKRM